MKRAFALAIAFCVFAADPNDATAQQAQNIQRFTLFEGPDSVDVKPDVARQLADAMRQAERPPECPLGWLRLRVRQGDDLYQEALVNARRDAARIALESLGVRVIGRLWPDLNWSAPSASPDTMFEWQRDTVKPTLDTASRPQKGHKVQERTPIRVTMTARDNSDRWQTGIKTIRLIADSEGGRDVIPRAQNYPACSEPPEKRVEATYTVPDNPPPIVRLRAIATDHAGLSSEPDIGEFPTGDWYGTITSTVKGNVYNDTAKIEFAINVAADGSLTARARARVTMEPFMGGPWPCLFSHTISPNEFDVEINVTRLSPSNEFVLKPSTAGNNATFVYSQQQCGPGMVDGTGPPAQTPFNALAMFNIVRGIRVPVEDGGTNAMYHTQGDQVLRDRIIIHRARQ